MNGFGTPEPLTFEFKRCDCGTPFAHGYFWVNGELVGSPYFSTTDVTRKIAEGVERGIHDEATAETLRAQLAAAGLPETDPRPARNTSGLPSGLPGGLAALLGGGALPAGLTVAVVGPDGIRILGGGEGDPLDFGDDGFGDLDNVG